MTQYPNLTIVCVDNGLFPSVAVRLAQSVGRVLYFCPWTSRYSSPFLAKIGSGLPNVERIKYLFAVIREAELDKEHYVFAFLDVHFADLQEDLRARGFTVWGAGDGEDLELFRWDAKKLLREVGLPVGKCELCKGLNALREYLRHNENVWVKVSEMRGISETWKSYNYALSQGRLDKLQHELGPIAEEQEWIVEHEIDTPVENGGDFYTIDGDMPKTAFNGIEEKDAAYAVTAMSYDQIAAPVRNINEKLKPVFKQYGYRGFFSSEVRKGKLVDATTRCPSPPVELMQGMISNFSEIIVEGARGKLIEPDIVKKYGFEFILYSEFAPGEWLAVQYPKEIEQNVKLYNVLRRQGLDWIVPTWKDIVGVGAVTGYGDTFQEAADAALKNAEQVTGDCLHIKKDAMPSLFRKLRESVKNGIAFGESAIPE